MSMLVLAANQQGEQAQEKALAVLAKFGWTGYIAILYQRQVKRL
jgi:hypothetical protein